MTYVIDCPDDQIAKLRTFLAENGIPITLESPADVPAWQVEEVLRREQTDTGAAIAWSEARKEYVGRGL